MVITLKLHGLYFLYFSDYYYLGLSRVSRLTSISGTSCTKLSKQHYVLHKFSSEIPKMRTVDPELWSKKVKGRKMELAQPLRFGPGEPGLRARIMSYSYSDAMGEFRRNCSVAAYRNLACQYTGKWERLVSYVSTITRIIIPYIHAYIYITSRLYSQMESAEDTKSCIYVPRSLLAIIEVFIINAIN